MRPPFYTVEVLNTLGTPIATIDNAISLNAARSYGVVGNATLTLLPEYDEAFFPFNTRFKLWRTGDDYLPALFGDTVWFLRKFRNAISQRQYIIELADAMTLLDNPVVAYTSRTPYADKTLEEFALVEYTDYFRIDNLMKEYVRENFGADALDTSRSNPYIVVEQNLNLAPHGEKTAAWAKLGSTLNDLANMSAEKGMELYYDLIPQVDGRFLFRVWKEKRGIDRGFNSVESLVFSDENNDLDDIEVVYDYSNMGTYCYVLGYDSGPSQMVEEVGNSAIIRSDPFGRVEFTHNESDSDVTAILEASGQSALYGRRPRRVLSAKLSAGSALRYGIDFAYGDKVGVLVRGNRYDCQVSAVNASWSAGVETLDIRLDGSESLWNPTWWKGKTPTPVVVPPVNHAPVVSAGADQSVSLSAGATLNGTVTDDGLPNPPGAVTTEWTKVSGPGAVTFGDASAVDTTASFSVIGDYVLRLTASDGALSASDDTAITVTAVAFDGGLKSGVNNVAIVDDQGYIYRTSNFQDASPTWDRVQDDSTALGSYTYSYVVDPFSPLYRGTGGTVNFYYADATGVHKINDMFGTPTWQESGWFNDVGDFGFAGADQWRTVEASFGRFFETETDNPWLMVISYVGDAAPGGTNAIYSLDAGQTWNDAVPIDVAEVYLNNFYDTSAATHGLQPIGVYLSPKTPGLAYTFAYDETVTPAVGKLYRSTDWGATWTQMDGAPVDDPAEPLPLWALWPDGGSLTLMGYGGQAGATARAVESGAVSGVTEDGEQLILAPPANTKRVLAAGLWSASKAHSGSGSGSTNLTLGTPTGTTRTDDLTFTGPADNSSTEGSFTVEWTKTIVGDWPVNRDSIVSSPPALPTSGARIRPYASANSSPDNTYTSTVRITLRILEIELDDGTIYTPPIASGVEPGHSLGYALHLPWPNNDNEDVIYHGWADRAGVLRYQLRRVVGGTVDDISPLHEGRSYGVAAALYPGDIDFSTQTQAFGVKFGVRTYDSNRQYVALAGMANDTSSDIDDNLFAVFVSGDYGDTWTAITTPVSAATKHCQEVAFAGDDPNVLFLWGSKGYIAYSDDFGATVQDKTGNLISSFTTIGNIIGIAGGDTPA